MSNYRGELLIPAPVVAETCFFLSNDNKVRMLDWLMTPKRTVLYVPYESYPEVGAIL